MSTAISCFPALIDIAEDEQCEELEAYLCGKGAEITSTGETELLVRLQNIVEQCQIVFFDSDLPSEEVEGFFFSVVSLFHVIPKDQTREILDLFCSKLATTDNTKNGPLRFRLLGIMLQHLTEEDALSFVVLCHRVALAQQLNLTSSLRLQADRVCRWVKLWALDQAQTRQLYQALWEACKDSDNKTFAAKILTELIKTYPPEEAHQVSELARLLIVLVLADPEQYLFDHILQLPAVAALKADRELVLLKIFASEKLSAFLKFYEANKEFVDSLGLDYQQCVRKLRFLTLASLAVESGEIPFNTLREELSLQQEQLDMCILEALRRKLIVARIDQVGQKLIVTSTIYRSFATEQWQEIHDRLSAWQKNIESVKTSLKSVKTT